MDGRGADQVINVRQILVVGEQIITVGASPERLEIGIADKYLRRSRSIRTIFQVVPPSIPKQCALIRIKENGREGVIRVRLNQFAWCSGRKRICQGFRSEVRIEHRHGNTSRMEEDDHHDSQRKETTYLVRRIDEDTRNAKKYGSCGQHQRKP